jgi:hypothetical protein
VGNTLVGISIGIIQFWYWGKPTLGDLLSLVDLGDLLVEELITLLTDLDDLLSLKAKSYIDMSDHRQENEKVRDKHTTNSLEDVVRNLRGGLVLGQGIGVVEGVV